MSPPFDAPTPPSNRPSQPATALPSVSSGASGRIVLWSGWGAAACFALSTAYFGANYFAARGQLALATNDAEFARTESQSLAQRLEVERILSSHYIASLQKAGDAANLAFIRLTGTSDSAAQPPVAIAIWNHASQQGVLVVEKLPALAVDHEYQLWISDPAHQDPVNAGTFAVQADGTARIAFRPDKPTTAATLFTITRERKGGAPKPEGPVLASGTL